MVFAKVHLKDILSQEAIILIICGENSKIPNNLIFLKVKFLESKQRLKHRPFTETIPQFFPTSGIRKTNRKSVSK